MRRLVWLYFLIMPLLGCQQGDAAGSGAAPPPVVSVVEIQPRRTELRTELPGRTVPYAVADVRPQVNGILEARLFVEGGVVEAGQPLYRIDDTLYQSAYDSARAELASAQAALKTARLRADRYRSLRSQKSISQQELDDADMALEQGEANVAEQEAQVASARINLNYTLITAPISGRIGRSYLTQGALVTANQAEALSTIQTLDPIYVDMNQSSTEMLALRHAVSAGRMAPDPTASVTLTLDDGTQYALQGTLRFSEMVVDRATGTVTLRAEFPNPDSELLPGMFVRAGIVQGVKANALLVPHRAVDRDNRGVATAMVVDSADIAHIRTLTVDQTVGSDWLVSGGIDPGDRVIVEGLQYVRSGQPVNPRPFASSAASKTPVPAADE